MVGKLLAGKSVVIAGAGSGVGRAASQLFARHGARLVCADIMADWVAETVRLVQAEGGEAIAVTCNVVSEADIQRAIDAAVDAYGRLDVIYNNVGITGGPVQLAETSEEQFEKLVSVNFGGVVRGSKLAVRQFRKQGSGGVIVNTASVSGLIGWGGVVYGGTKGAVVAMTRTLAMEVAKDGIRVNSVCPGGMITNFGADEPFATPTPETVAAMGKFHPLGRPIDPMDCANAALFLASDLSSNITGVNLPVDGGLSAG
jgi:NAD(P)-dependent dehydrogenase (short-subunit alcohol dehydrogenase family)